MSTEKTQKYADIRKLTQEQKEAEEIDLEVEYAANQINTDLQNAKSVVVSRKKELASAIKAATFNTATILNAKRQLALAQKDVEDITKLKEELF